MLGGGRGVVAAKIDLESLSRITVHDVNIRRGNEDRMARHCLLTKLRGSAS
jgi:hypothetical protein